MGAGGHWRRHHRYRGQVFSKQKLIQNLCQLLFIASVFIAFFLVVSFFVSFDRSSYSDGGLSYINRSAAQPLFEILSISANIFGFSF